MIGEYARPVRKAGLRDEVYHAIVEMIVEGRLPDGAPLRVEALAQMLEVSPTPVREALVQLESTGLVDYVANKGYTVAPLPSAEDMRQIMDARVVLDVGAARRAAEREARGFVQELDALVEAQAEAASRVEPEHVGSASPLREYLRLDHAFHDAIFRECGNPYLARLAKSMDAQSQRVRQSYIRGVDDSAEVIAEHAAIARAIEQGDPDAAEAATRAHLSRVLAKALADFS